jgi:CRP/FNR family cyclic AMP-dependent transcriptional regulator
VGREDADNQPFMDQMNAATAAALRQLGQWRGFAAKEVLSRQGEPGKSVLIVDSGVVKVTVAAAAGEEVVAGFYGRGELLGEVSALRGTRRSATVTGHCAGGLIEIPGDAFREFVWRHELFLVVLATAGQRLRRADMHRLSYAGDGVPSRVGSTLLDWAQRYGRLTDSGTEIDLRVSRHELAQVVLASEKTVDNVLTTLTRAGLITTGRRRFVVLDAAGLHRWVHDRARS